MAALHGMSAHEPAPDAFAQPSGCPPALPPSPLTSQLPTTTLLPSPMLGTLTPRSTVEDTTLPSASISTWREKERGRRMGRCGWMHWARSGCRAQTTGQPLAPLTTAVSVSNAHKPAAFIPPGKHDVCTAAAGSDSRAAQHPPLSCWPPPPPARRPQMTCSCAASWWAGTCSTALRQEGRSKQCGRAAPSTQHPEMQRQWQV